MRGFGCTLNDMADKDFDAQVERTKTRPLPAKEVTMAGAAGWLVAQGAMGLVVLSALTPATALVAFASIPLVAIYPFMKRVTNAPQAVLGLVFNWGVWVGLTEAACKGAKTAAPGYAALLEPNGFESVLAHAMEAVGSSGLAVAAPLYATGFFWTLM